MFNGPSFTACYIEPSHVPHLWEDTKPHLMLMNTSSGKTAVNVLPILCVYFYDMKLITYWHYRKLSSMPDYIVQSEHVSAFFRCPVSSSSNISSLNTCSTTSSTDSSTNACRSASPSSAKLCGKRYTLCTD